MPEPIHKTLVAPNDTRHLAEIRRVVDEVSAPFFPVKTERGKIVLAVDEAVSNVMEHAYAGCSTPGDIEVDIQADDTRLQVIIRDSGKPFDPLSIRDPDLKEHIRQGKRNGLGLFLMRQIMDEVKYSFVEGRRNELRMVKYITAATKTDKGEE